MTLQELLGIELPIIQAPMAGVQGSALAIAVSNAGGLGSLPCAMLDLDGIRKELGVIRSQTARPCNVNFFCHAQPEWNPERERRWRTALAPYFTEQGIDSNDIATGRGRLPFSHEAADVLDEFKPAVVSFHFGLPDDDLMARVRACGAKVLSTATTVDEARWLEARGVDAVIAQGLEAGGHRGMFLSSDLSTQTGTFALVPQMVRAVHVPVIAAGGIADAKGVAAAMALGAAGAQLGTVLPAVPGGHDERPASRGAEERRRPAYGNHQCLHRATRARDLQPPDPRAGADERCRSRVSAGGVGHPALADQGRERQVSNDFSPMWAGQNASGCKEIPAAVAHTGKLAARLRRALTQAVDALDQRFETSAGAAFTVRLEAIRSVGGPDRQAVAVQRVQDLVIRQVEAVLGLIGRVVRHERDPLARHGQQSSTAAKTMLVHHPHRRQQAAEGRGDDRWAHSVRGSALAGRRVT